MPVYDLAMTPTSPGSLILIGLLTLPVAAQIVPPPQPTPLSTATAFSSIVESPPAAVTPPAAEAPATPAPTFAATRDDGIVPLPHVEKRGTGPIAMVMIPAAGCDWSCFDTFVERNKERYTHYVVNLPGFGGSLPPPSRKVPGEWIDNAAKAVWAYIVENKVEKPVIVGHSLGGHIALKIGLAHSDELRAVVVLDGVPAFPGKEGETQVERVARAGAVRQSLENLTDDQWDAMQLRNASTWIAHPSRASVVGEMLMLHPRVSTLGYLEELLVVDIRHDLPKLKVKTLVIAALAPGLPAEKAPASKNQLTDLFAKATTAKVVFFDNSRHFVHEDQPAAVDAAIENFLKGEEVGDFHGPAPVVPARVKGPPPIPPVLKPGEPGDPVGGSPALPGVPPAGPPK